MGKELQDKEKKWMETIKAFNEKATEIKDYPKKQEAVIQAITQAEKQKAEQDKGVKNSNDEIR